MDGVSRYTRGFTSPSICNYRSLERLSRGFLWTRLNFVRLPWAKRLFDCIAFSPLCSINGLPSWTAWADKPILQIGNCDYLFVTIHSLCGHNLQSTHGFMLMIWIALAPVDCAISSTHLVFSWQWAWIVMMPFLSTLVIDIYDISRFSLILFSWLQVFSFRKLPICFR